MKKRAIGKIGVLVVLVMFILTSLSTAVFAWNWDNEGNEPGANDFLGTTTNTDLRIKTNGNQRMVVKADGKIGIGTANPQQMLTLGSGSNFATEMSPPTGLEGEATSGGSLTTGEYTYKVVALDSTGGETTWSDQHTQFINNSLGEDAVELSWSPVLGAASYRIYGRAVDAQNQYWTPDPPTDTFYTDDGTDGTSGTPPDITTAYVNKLTASGNSWINGGNVGIGTINPTNPLELLSTTTPQFRITHTAATDYATFSVDTDGQLDITTVDGEATGGHICLMPDGNVGIGTINPGSYKLNIAGSMYADTVNTGYGNNELYAMNQNVRTTDPVTFATVNTGCGNNELYAMNQHVRTTDSITFATVDTGYGACEIGQDLRTIDHVIFATVDTGTINTGFGYCQIGQNLRTTDSVTFATINTGWGNNELFAMNQHVRKTDPVTFATVETGTIDTGYGVCEIGQNLRTTDNVDFNQMDITDYLTASGGIHVGGTGDPGDDNLIVDGLIGIGRSPVGGGGGADRKLDCAGPVRIGDDSWYPSNDVGLSLIAKDNTQDTIPLAILNPSGDHILYVRGNGNIGISNYNPDKMLHIGSNGIASGTIRFESSDGDEVDLGITNSDDFYITGGNVGIGTSTPDPYQLKVEGDIWGNTIYGYSIDTGHGNNELYAMNQNVRTTDSVTFATVDMGTINTGYGAYEIGQNLRTTDSVTFATVNTGTINTGYGAYEIGQNLRTTDSVTFATVNTGTIDTGYGVCEIGQNLRTTDNPTFNRIQISDYGYALGGFHVGGTSDPGTDNLIVDGKVGIGCSPGSEKLKVQGDIYASGKISCPGTIISNWANIGLAVTAILMSVVKYFRIDHPLDPQNKNLTHGCLEGPEHGVYYRGNGTLVNGTATITLPTYYNALTMNNTYTVMLTSKGNTTFDLSYDSFNETAFIVYGSVQTGEFDWLVQATRGDVDPLEVETDK